MSDFDVKEKRFEEDIESYAESNASCLQAYILFSYGEGRNES